jgi:hypothetical protein
MLIITRFPPGFIIRTVSFDLEGTALFLCTLDLVQDGRNFFEPLLVLPLDNQHESLNCLLPPLRIHTCHLSQLDHVERLVKLEVFQIELNEFLKGFLG